MLRPIDNQIALVADVMRNNAATMRQGELNQSYQAIHAKAAAERRQRSVSQLTKMEKTEIKTDVEGGSGQQYEGYRIVKRVKIAPPLSPEEDFVPPDPNGEPTIDISI